MSVEMTGFGPTRTSSKVRNPVAIGGKADTRVGASYWPSRRRWRAQAWRLATGPMARHQRPPVASTTGAVSRRRAPPCESPLWGYELAHLEVALCATGNVFYRLADWGMSKKAGI